MTYTALEFFPAIIRGDLVCDSISEFLNKSKDDAQKEEVEVAEINPAHAGGNDFCREYGIPIEEGANCVIVKATRGSISTIAACVAPVNHRIDFNGVVRKTLNARRVSLLPVEEVLEATGMEYGSITPFGLPADWVILLDSRLLFPIKIVVGAGLLKSKIRLPGKMLADLPNAQVVENLAAPKEL